MCCTDKEKDSILKKMCEGTASAYGRGTKLPAPYQGRIVLCPEGMNNMDTCGGCGCLLVHELLHRHGFINQGISSQNRPGTNSNIERKNRANENGMVRLARLLLKRNCKGYDTW